MPRPCGACVERTGFKSAGDESDPGKPTLCDREEASSSIKSTNAALPELRTDGGDGIAWGSGEGGAGHRPGRAAARSTRLSVCWCCCAARFLRASNKLEVPPVSSGCDCSVCLVERVGGAAESVLESGRGGEGVRSTGEKSATSNPCVFPGVRKDCSEVKLSSNDGESNDWTGDGLKKEVEEEWNSVKSSSSNRSTRLEGIVIIGFCRKLDGSDDSGGGARAEADEWERLEGGGGSIAGV